MFKRILAATDGSDHSVRAIEAAAKLAQATGARLTVATVAYVPRLYQVDLGSELQQGFRDSARRILDDARQAVPEAVTTDYRLLEGQPAEALARLVRDERFDLVVLGRRGMGAAPDRQLGGVSERVLREADCSVMLVR